MDYRDLPRKKAPKRMSKEQDDKFIHALFNETCGNARQAAVIAGFNEQHYIHLMKRLRKEILETAETVVAAYSVEAAFKLGDILSDEGAVRPGVNARLIAAQSILDRVGIVKKDKVEVTTNGALGAIFILPPKQPVSVIQADDGSEEKNPS